MAGPVGYFHPSTRENTGQYDHNLDCRWTITPEDETEIHLLIVDIDIDPDTACRFDFLKVQVLVLLVYFDTIIIYDTFVIQHIDMGGLT